MPPNMKYLLFLCLICLIILPSPAAAFGAGNIASISRIEGHNWRHGDIEDMLKTVACLKGHKWTSMMIKRVYFGNWLRDYSQAVDVGTLKGVQADTIRILVWVLAFMSFGYATGEFEVTTERLGVYRPEEHIDNPKDYADNVDARQYDQRLRPPVQPLELAVDPNTGMKNYIANEHGGWATSAGFVKHSFSRSIHFGRVYTHGGSGTKGREADLCEALRCLGQGLHCLEDFGAHTNYTELALRELGFTNVFPHCGSASQINLRGKAVFPLVTGTFGGVDFLHSVLGEAHDHITQSEIDEMNSALGNAQTQSTADGLNSLLSKIPGTGGLVQEANRLQAASQAQASTNTINHNNRGLEDNYSTTRASYIQDPFTAPPGSIGGPPAPGITGPNISFDPATTLSKIYPILEFRDKVVRTISTIVSKIPGLESLVDKITERVTLFIMGLLAPFIMPLVNAASVQLKQGSSAVINSSGRHQYEPWTDPYCTDPTHSLLSKDHFSNILNAPAGQVAAAILQYVAPRIVYAWDHPNVPEQQVLDDIVRVFHHPAIRDPHCEVHRNMFSVVERWVQSRPDQGHSLNDILSSDSVRAGHNHSGGAGNPHTNATSSSGAIHGAGSHSNPTDSAWDAVGRPPSSSYSPAAPAYSVHQSDPNSQQLYHPPPLSQQQYQAPAPPLGSYGQYDQPLPQAAGALANDPYTYPTAFQQGYEVPYDQQGAGYGGLPQQQYQQYEQQQYQQYGSYEAPPPPPHQQHDPNAPPGGFGEGDYGYDGGYGAQSQHYQPGYGGGGGW